MDDATFNQSKGKIRQAVETNPKVQTPQQKKSISILNRTIITFLYQKETDLLVETLGRKLHY